MTLYILYTRHAVVHPYNDVIMMNIYVCMLVIRWEGYEHDNNNILFYIRTRFTVTYNTLLSSPYIVMLLYIY